MEAETPETEWALTFAAADGVADERTGGAGAQSLSLVRNHETNNGPGASRDIVVTAGKWYVFRAWQKKVTCSYIFTRISDATRIWYAPSYTGEEWAQVETIARAASTSFSTRLHTITTADAQEGRFDDVEMKLLTLNAQTTMSGSDAEITFTFTLPTEAAYRGQRVEVFYRIQGTLESEFNCWVARIERNNNNNNWNFRLGSVVNGVETVQASLNDVGTPEQLKVVCYGTQHQCYMAVSGTWTPLHDVVDVDYLADQTGLNTIYSEGVTPVSLEAKAAAAFESGLVGTGLAFLDGDSKTDPTASYGYWDFMFEYAAERDTNKDWTYYNVAAAGRTLATGLTALPASLAALPDTPAPDCALVNFGANDVTALPAEATWKDNLRTYVETLHAKWASTPIFIMRPWSQDEDADCDTLAGWIADVVAEYEYANLGPDERVFLKGADNGTAAMLPPNGIHPNGWGSRLTALEWVATVTS